MWNWIKKSEIWENIVLIIGVFSLANTVREINHLKLQWGLSLSTPPWFVNFGFINILAVDYIELQTFSKEQIGVSGKVKNEHFSRWVGCI